MLPSTTATSRPNRGGGGQKQRRGGLRTNQNNGGNSAANSDDDAPRKGRKVHFSADNQSQAASVASRGQRGSSTNHAVRGAASSRAGRAASAKGGSTAPTKPNPLAQIKAHIGDSNNTNARAPSPAALSTNNVSLQAYEERFHNVRNKSTQSNVFKSDSQLSKLKERRPREKAEAIRNGTYQDPEKPVSLADAITIVGECLEMCPEYERVRRVREMDVWAEEATAQTAHLPNSKRVPVEQRMVKKFVRSAAGMEEQLPSDLRPPHILQATLDYLINDIVGEALLGKIHHFVWDRTRCIRNDFSIQQVTREEDVRLAMDCFERTARFHIVSSHQLRDPESRGDRFDPQQEREQLDKTLLSLFQYYEDNEARLHSQNEPEFRAYQIVFELKSLKNNIEERLSKWDPRLADSSRIQACMKLHRAACVFEEPLGPGKFDAAALQATEERYRAFWQLLAADEITFAEACIAEFSFNALRSRGFRYLWRANRKAIKDGQQRSFTTYDLAPLLGFCSAEEANEWIQMTGTPVDQDGTISMNVPGGPRSPDVDVPRSSALVQQKRKGRRLPAIINNVDSEENSLFVPETNPAPPVFNPQAASFTPAPTNSLNSGSNLNGDPNTSKNNTWTPTHGINFRTSVGFGGASQSQPQEKKPLFQSFAGSATALLGDHVSFSAPAQSHSNAANDEAEKVRQVAEQQAQERAAEEGAKRRAAEEAARQRAEEMARAEAEQRRLAQEAEARRVAEQAAKQRAAEEAQHRREVQAREAAEQQRRAQEEASRVAAQRKARRAATLDTLAHTVITQPNDGLLEQFIQFLAAPLIEQERAAHLERQAIVRVRQIYQKQLTRKYALKWRALFWQRKIDCAGKARRQRARDAARQRQEREELESSQRVIGSDLDLNVSTSSPSAHDSHTQSLAPMLPPPRPDAGPRRSMGQSLSRQAQPVHPSTKPPVGRLKSLSTPARDRRLQPLDKTASSYFKLQSLGIKPPISPASKRTHQEYVHEHGTPPGVASPQSSADAARPSKRLANESATSRDGNNPAAPRSSGSISTADLIAQSQKMLANMAETKDWFREESERMTRESAASSRRSSFNGPMPTSGDAASKALGSPAAESISSQSSRVLDPLKYRSRASKFLPRDQYADLRRSGNQSPARVAKYAPGGNRSDDSLRKSGNEAIAAAEKAIAAFKQSQAMTHGLKAAAQQNADVDNSAPRSESHRSIGWDLFGPVGSNGEYATTQSSAQPGSVPTGNGVESGNLVSSTPPLQPTAGLSFSSEARPGTASSSLQLPAAQARSPTASFRTEDSHGAAPHPPAAANGVTRKRSLSSESETETQRRKQLAVSKKQAARKPMPPSNFNPFQLLGEGNDDEDTEEEVEDDDRHAASGSNKDEDGEEASVGFSDVGQGTEDEDSEQDEESYEEGEEESEESEEDEAPARAPPLIHGRGGTSIEDAIEL